MKYLTIFTVVIAVTAGMFSLQSCGKEESDSAETTTTVSKTTFEPVDLYGEWAGPGMFHLTDTSTMDLLGKFTFSKPETGSYIFTSTEFSGHEYKHSDSGHLVIDGDRVFWTIWDPKGNELEYFGSFADKNLIHVSYPKPPFVYSTEISFVAPGKLLLRNYLKNDTLLSAWMEFTLEPFQENKSGE